jgi:uncharacterized protein (TIGR03435 family)
MGRMIVALALFHVARALGQTPATAPAFEVAAVKVSHEPPGSDASKSTLGSLWMRNMTPRAIIAMAYSVKELQVVGGPKWLDSERYDIDAKAAGPAQGTELRSMLQTLLAERFQVALHRETRISPGYVLLVVKSGVKTHAAEPGKLGISSHNGHMIAEKASMADLAKDLSRRWGVEVEDATGLTSVYDFQLDLPERDRNNAAPSADSSATDAADPASYATALSHALEDQLGLKLQERKIPVDVLVIDRAEKPVEN